MMKRSLPICAVLAFGLGYSAAASAQDHVWLQDRRYQEGMGIRTGDLELHPGAAAEFGYDSNFFLRSNKVGAIPALRLRITPSFSISTLSPQRRVGEGAAEPPKIAFRANVAGTYHELIAVRGGDQDALSKYRNVSGLASFKLRVLPERPLGGDVYGDFIRSIQPSQDPDNNFNRLSARFGAGVQWAPGGGMFDWRLGYEYAMSFFEDEAFRDLNTEQHQINTHGRWRFLPRTALLYDATLGFLRYPRHPAGRLDSDPVRARIGLNSLLTPSLGILAMVGWGSSFYQGNPNAQQFDSVIGQGEVRWYITPNPNVTPGAVSSTLSSVAVGYTRDFVNSYVSDHYSRDRFYLTGSAFFGGFFLLTADAGVSLLGYSAAYNMQRQPLRGSFQETRVEATLFGEYRVADSFGINATTRYSANMTDTVLNYGTAATGPYTAYIDWNRFEAYVGLRWFM